jgi:hypothetical protein
MTVKALHILMSPSKAIKGPIAGILLQKQGSMSRSGSTGTPLKVERTAYTGATIRDLLNMRAAIALGDKQAQL